ncbi:MULTISPECIES: flavin reductase family protein [unclassified Pseudonocardia]|uniref:flavin reductase family protein n=1 Tax=unclassified Pseudonocardia TaxID=2619320 RepID=UPI0001FFE692|nr:flavin reductase family protein [Pseudonocardia sp. Ae707_Ps1]OLM08962.1 Nitrilotriacetate monooxygenase component B [Pseudonocardia sp. Ae707_Ps1]
MIETDPLTGDVDQLRHVFGCFPSGVAAICAMVDGEPVGMAASSFTSVSMKPPLVSVCVQNSSSTWPKLREASRLGVSLLAQDQGMECASLARKNGDRFAEIAWRQNGSGGVLILGATAWLDCSIHQEVAAGDHAIILLRIHGVWSDSVAEPLVFHRSRLRRLVAM